ncbi:MAG: trypsin-like peptidase domain-containing protein [Armatimonadetes bacterium]|nr:trypsin-like peptidase domain-containing protein [Armatimonadota bacterium]
MALSLWMSGCAGPPPALQPTLPASATARDLSRDFASICDRVLPAVVSIDAVRVGSTPSGASSEDPFLVSQPGADLFVPPSRGAPSVGSGFLIREDGYLVTNRHVVERVRDLRVTLADGRVAAPRLVGSDGASDLALLKIELSGLPTLEWGSSADLQVGEWVLAFGNPYRMHGSVTHGIISAKGRQGLGIADYEDFIQTDAPINPGNSGGPLVDLDGRVVGINTAILSETGASHGIGLAIPSDAAQELVEELLESGSVERSWIGVMIRPVDAAAARRLGLQRPGGLLVISGYKDSPAGRAGFQADDVLLELDGHGLKDEGAARTLLARVPVGQEIRARVWRDRAIYEVKLKTCCRMIDSRGRPARGI